MCHVGTKSARPFIAPSSEPQWGLTQIEPLRPCFPGSNRRSRSDGRKLSIPSTYCTLVARRGAPSMNSLAGLDALVTCAPSRRTPSPRNSWSMGHTGPAQVSIRFINKQLFDLWKVLTPEDTVSLTLSTQSSLLSPSGVWGQESLRVWIPFSRSSYCTPGRLSNHGFAISVLLTYVNSKFQRSGEED